MLNDIDRIYIIKDINFFYAMSSNAFVTYLITEMLANISEHVQNEPTLLANIFTFLCITDML